MNRTVETVAGCLVAGAISLGATAGASAKQTDPAFPPFSNACLKAGGTVSQANFSQAGQLVSVSCTKPFPAEFSSEETERVLRACGQLGANLGATQALALVGTGFVRCELVYPV
jgi:hypothetical protein